MPLAELTFSRPFPHGLEEGAVIRDFFSPANLMRTVTIPPVPTLDVERYAAWPYPGMTASDQACSWLSTSTEYTDMLEAVIRSQGDAELNNDQVKAPIPQTDAIS